MLISETHFTEKSYLKLPKYIFHTRTARDGTAIIIKNSIKHHQLNNYSQDFLQATSVSVKDSSLSVNNFGCLSSTQTYRKQEQREDFYNTLRHRFIAGRLQC
jgi:exonuclease III